VAIEVAAAVLQRGDGAFLVAQRPAGKVYAGYWEFPGGKVEEGESVADALARELHEELGIEVAQSFPWLTRTFIYPHGTVRLHFRRVTAWSGEPHPREQQSIAWQRPGRPGAAPMLPANAPVLAALALPQEYAITDAGRLGERLMLERLARRLEGGLHLLQVREPGMEPAARARFTARAIAMAHRHGCRVMTKEPFDGADGIHLTARALMSLGKKPALQGLVAASCHARSELERAMALDLDFAVLGPVHKTASHPGREPLGWKGFETLARASSIPVYAIGGVQQADRDAAWKAGAHGLAMISGAWDRE
jgi:8-oxo-dGTP diphosphatase